MNIIPDVVMVPLISGQCVQNLVQRNKRENSYENKDLKGGWFQIRNEKRCSPPGIAPAKAFAAADSEDRT
jgi:hypothetical protein